MKDSKSFEFDDCMSTKQFYKVKCFNRSSRRKRGMASNQLIIIADILFCIFQKNSAMATLGLKKMGKFLQTYGSHSKVRLENAKTNLVL